MRETVSEEVKAIERGRREKSVRARGFKERERESRNGSERTEGRKRKGEGGDRGRATEWIKRDETGRVCEREEARRRERASDDEVEQEWDSARCRMKEGKGCKKARGG